MTHVQITLKKLRITFTLVILMLLCIPGFTAKNELTQKIRIGVLANRGPKCCVNKWRATAEYLTKAIPKHTFSIVPLSYDEVSPTVEKGEVEFVFVHPGFYIAMEHDYEARRIATLVNLCLGKGYTNYASVVFTRKDRADIKQLADIKGKSFIAVDKNAFAGWQMAWRLFKDNGIDPHEDFADLRFAGTHDAVINAVRDGEIDAGCVRSDLLERMAAEGKITLDTFKVLKPHNDTDEVPFLHSTRHYPEWPFAKLRSTPDDLSEMVATALFKMPSNSSAAQTGNCLGWTIPANYKSVRECLKIIQINPYENYGKVTIIQAIRQHWISVGSLLVFFVVILILGIYAMQSKKRILNSDKTIRESENLLRNIFENSTNLFYSHTPDNKITYLSPQVKDILGYTQEEACVDWTSLISENPLNKIALKNTKKAIETGKAQPTYELELLHKNGEKVFVEVREAPLVKNGKTVAIVGALADITERKKAEDSFRIEQYKTKKILDTIPDGVYIVSKQYEIEYINPVIQKEFGEINNRKCYEYFHKRTTPCPWCKNREVFSGNSVIWEWFSPKNNKSYDLLDTPFKNSDGTLSKLEIFRDITKAKHAEEKNIHLNHVLSAISDVNKLITREKDSVELLNKTCDILVKTHGYYNARIILLDKQKKYFAFGAAGLNEDFKQIREWLENGNLPKCAKKALHEKKIIIIEDPKKTCYDCPLSKHHDDHANFTIRLEYNEVIYGLLSISLPNSLIKEKEESDLFEELAADISFALYSLEQEEKRRKAEDKLSRNQYYLKKAQELGKIGTWELDILKNILIWTEENYRIFGFPIGMKLNYDIFINRIHPDDRDYVNKAWNAALNHEPYDIEHRIIIDGKVKWIREKATIEFDKKGKAIKAIGVAQDISEQKKAATELQRIQKLESIGTLAGGIAHDFNNILTGILGNISLAKIKLSKDHSSFAFLEESEKSLNRATRLTNQLLTFSKGGNPVLENVSIFTLVEDIVHFDLTGSNVKPIFKSPKDLWNANVDKGQIQQVFSNLVINANQAMPDGGCLYITLQNANVNKNAIPGLKPGKYIKATVRDEGIGVDQKHLKEIFDPYFTTKQAGSGLGLATTYSIINKHGGNISVDSELSKGTIFTLYIPAAESEKTHIKKQDSTQLRKIKKSSRILVMDDEEVIIVLITAILEVSGCSVETVLDGKQAIEMYQQAMDNGNVFDAVIMDLTIPGGMGGKEAVKEIIKIDKNAKCIVSSGYANDPILANYGEYGFKGIIQKPYAADKLLKVLSHVLEMS